MKAMSASLLARAWPSLFVTAAQQRCLFIAVSGDNIHEREARMSVALQACLQRDVLCFVEALRSSADYFEKPILTLIKKIVDKSDYIL